MLYNSFSSAHPMLTAKAKALGVRFDPFVELAESLLGLAEPVYTLERDVAEVELAIALQVNFMAEQGVDALVLESVSSSQTNQSVVYRDRLIDPRAALMIVGVDRRHGFLLRNARYANLRSLRANGEAAGIPNADLR